MERTSCMFVSPGRHVPGAPRGGLPGAAYRITGNAMDAEDVLQTVFHPVYCGARSRRRPFGRAREATCTARRSTPRWTCCGRRKRARSATLDEAVDTLVDTPRPGPGAQAPPRGAVRSRAACGRRCRLPITSSGPSILTSAISKVSGQSGTSRSMLGASQTSIAVLLHRARHRLQKELGIASKEKCHEPFKHNNADLLDRCRLPGDRRADRSAGQIKEAAARVWAKLSQGGPACSPAATAAQRPAWPPFGRHLDSRRQRPHWRLQIIATTSSCLIPAYLVRRVSPRRARCSSRTTPATAFPAAAPCATARMGALDGSPTRTPPPAAAPPRRSPSLATVAIWTSLAAVRGRCARLTALFILWR